jgi:hypothetical protein
MFRHNNKKKKKKEVKMFDMVVTHSNDKYNELKAYGVTTGIIISIRVKTPYKTMWGMYHWHGEGNTLRANPGRYAAAALTEFYNFMRSEAAEHKIYFNRPNTPNRPKIFVEIEIIGGERQTLNSRGTEQAFKGLVYAALNLAKPYNNYKVTSLLPDKHENQCVNVSMQKDLTRYKKIDNDDSSRPTKSPWIKVR